MRLLAQDTRVRSNASVCSNNPKNCEQNPSPCFLSRSVGPYAAEDENLFENKNKIKIDDFGRSGEKQMARKRLELRVTTTEKGETLYFLVFKLRVKL